MDDEKGLVLLLWSSAEDAAASDEGKRHRCSLRCEAAAFALPDKDDKDDKDDKVDDDAEGKDAAAGKRLS